MLFRSGVQPRPNGRSRTEVDPDRFARRFEEGLRARYVDGQQVVGGQHGQVQAQTPLQAAGQVQVQVQPMADVVWIDRLIVALATVLMILVVRYVGICLG